MKKISTCIAVMLFVLLHTSSSYAITYDIIVAKDGSGKYKTVQAAFNAVPKNSTKRTVIFIKNGTYKEALTLPSDRKNVTIIGESRDGVKLTYDNAAKKINPATGQEFGTSGSASFYMYAEGFYALNITFENSAGTSYGQALAIYISKDKAVFVNCRFLGRQDTIYGDRCRQYFKNCYIEGTTDFIFGPSTAYFESCQLYSYGGTALTAASTESYVKYGYVFQKCTISGKSGISTTLGRPWRPYAAVAYLNCSLSSIIKPAGWDNWGNAANEKTARFSEYMNTGAGAMISSRPSWIKRLSDSEASQYTVTNVLKTTYANPPSTDNWNPNTVITQTGARLISEDQENESASLNVYPNPAMEGQGITLSFEGFDVLTETKINIHNSLGKDVYHTSIKGKSQHFINAQFPTGIYIVNAENGFKKLQKKIIVKQH